MKTDRFSDIIRRKLESIRPEFSEKDWARMQSSLQTGIPQPGTPPSGNPFSGGLWTAKSWLMAAATVSAVVLVGYGFWQHNEINRLRQTIGQLRKQPTHQTAARQPTLSVPTTDTIASAPSTENQSLPGKEALLTSTGSKPVRRGDRDTVYITRYVSVPSRSHVVPPEEQLTNRSEKPTDQRYATTEHPSGSTAQPNQSDNLTNNPKTDAYGEPSTPSIVGKNPDISAETVTNSEGKRPRERRLADPYYANRQTNEQGVSRDRHLSPKNPATNLGNIQDNSIVRTSPAPTEPTTIHPTEASISANYELIDLPSISTPTINWTSQLAQRAKRMRPARTTVVSGAVVQAPESQPIKYMAGRFRAGVGGELASKVLSAGVFTEVLLGPKKNWSVGIGLSQATYNGTFLDDLDFDLHMKRDFRREFARNIDPRRQILNIDTRTTRIQIPVNVGYRISLNRNLVLSPTLGTSLNLTNVETGSYYCQMLIPQRGYYEILKFNTSQSVDLITHVAFGAGLEWQNRHWALQGSPVLTVPLQAEQVPMKPGPNWQTNVTLGLRARVLYQF
ncbi:hypothetical protein GCM10028818_15970 [Spirosoma horti]